MSHWLYEGIVTRVYDADTITVDLDMGMRVWQKGVSVRQCCPGATWIAEPA